MSSEKEPLLPRGNGDALDAGGALAPNLRSTVVPTSSEADENREKLKKTVRIASDTSSASKQSTSKQTKAAANSKNANQTYSSTATGTGNKTPTPVLRKRSQPYDSAMSSSVSVNIEALSSYEAANEIQKFKGVQNGSASSKTDAQRVVTKRALNAESGSNKRRAQKGDSDSDSLSSSLLLPPSGQLVSINQSDQLFSSSSDLTASLSSAATRSPLFTATPSASPFPSLPEDRSLANWNRSGSQARGQSPFGHVPSSSSLVDVPGRAEGARSKSLTLPSSNSKRAEDAEDDLIPVAPELQIPERRSVGLARAEEPEYVVYRWRWYVLAMLNAVFTLNSMNWCVDSLMCEASTSLYRVIS